MYMHLIRGLKQNLLTVTKCVHQQKLVNFSTTDAVKQHNVTFSNKVTKCIHFANSKLTLLLQAVQEMCSSTIV